MKKLITHLLIFSFLLNSLPLFAHTKQIELESEDFLEMISREGIDIDIINVDPDDPIFGGGDEDEDECEDPTNPNANTSIKSLAKNIIADTGSILIAPAGWTKEEWLKASAVVAGLMILSTQDSHVKGFSQSMRNSTTDKIAVPLEMLGNGAPALALLGAGYATSLVIKDEKLKNTSLTAIEGIAVAAVLTTIGKHTFHRQRPYTTDDQYKLHGPLKTSHVSFPSGHTGSAFALATVIAEAYGDNKIVPLLAYSAATLAGLSRVHDNKHWLTDVAAGAVLGHLAGKYVAQKRLLNKSGQSKIEITPSFDLGKNGGMNVTVKIPLGSKTKKKK